MKRTQSLDVLDQSDEFAFGIAIPARGPDPKIREYILAQLVTVAHGLGTVITRAITLDTEDVAARFVRMGDDIALIALYVFEVLYEVFEIATPLVAMRLLVCWHPRSFSHPSSFDQIALRLVHRDDTNGMVGPRSHRRGSLINNDVDLFEIAALSEFVSAINFLARHAKFRVLPNRAWIN